MTARTCDNLCAMIRNGSVTESTVDASAHRILTAMFAVGLFDHDVTKNGSTANNVTSPAHTDVARRVAAAGMVVLKNEKNFLPLTSDIKSIAVIGTQAADPYVHGGGSGAVVPLRLSTPLSALREKFGIKIPTGPLKWQWQTKIGRGGCNQAASLGSAHDIRDVSAAASGCAKVTGCVFFILSLDPDNDFNTVYYCATDAYNNVNNANVFPKWVVGHYVHLPPPPPDCTKSTNRCVYYADGTDTHAAMAVASKADVTILFGATDSGEGECHIILGHISRALSPTVVACCFFNVV